MWVRLPPGADMRSNSVTSHNRVISTFLFVLCNTLLMNNMGDVIRDAFSKYAQFQGRMTRRDYWQWWLFTLITYIAAGLLDGAVSQNSSLVSGLAILILFVPSITTQVRRLHDVGKRGWWMLIPFVNLYFYVQPSEGDNRFGPAPRP